MRFADGYVRRRRFEGQGLRDAENGRPRSAGESRGAGSARARVQGGGDVRIGKYLEIALNGATREDAEKRVREMCEKLLANMVIVEGLRLFRKTLVSPMKFLEGAVLSLSFPDPSPLWGEGCVAGER